MNGVDIPPNQTLYINNLYEKVKKDGEPLPLSFPLLPLGFTLQNFVLPPALVPCAVMHADEDLSSSELFSDPPVSADQRT